LAASIASGLAGAFANRTGGGYFSLDCFAPEGTTMHAIRAALAAAILANFALPALAQAPAGPALVAQYGDWGVYVSQAARTKICYALSQPKDRQPATLKRDPGYFFVSTRPGENVKNEVSIIAGFTIKDGSDATADIGGTAFTLYTKSDSAWVRNIAEEVRLVEALRRGRDLTVKSTSARGNATTDKYSLTGFAQALDRVAQECR
jgi:invasion protein IalB